jgi:outer membrane protein TolC
MIGLLSLLALLADPGGAVAAGAPPQPAASPADTLALTLDEAIARGLTNNLAALRAEAAVEAAAGRHWQALSALLPTASADVSAARQVINLAAFGFTAPGLPDIIGPFNVFDGRLRLSQPVVDLSALDRSRSEAARLTAARHDETDARRLVALVVTTLYVNAVAAASRVTAGRAELESARTLAQTAADLKAAGLVPQIDVLRAQVQFESVEQRQIALENTAERGKLALAQAIGLTPITTRFSLADGLTYVASAVPALDAAVAQANRDRADARAAAARLEAAKTAVRAENESRLPSLHVHGDYGTIGNTVNLAHPTFAASATVSVPLFDGQTNGRIAEAEANLRRVQAEADDLARQVAVDIQAALLDLNAAQRQVQVASHTVQLAMDQQTQAVDRFKAGITNNVEVVQAQAAVASANDAYVAGLSSYQLARAALARALGVPETAFRQFLTGVQP